MKDHNVVDVNKWSYVDEYVKNSRINKKRWFKEHFDEEDIHKKIIKAISQYPADAQSFRKDLLTLSKKPREFKNFIEGKSEFNEAVESSEEAGVGIKEVDVLKNFHKFLLGLQLGKNHNKIKRKLVIYQTQL